MKCWIDKEVYILWILLCIGHTGKSAVLRRGWLPRGAPTCTRCGYLFGLEWKRWRLMIWLIRKANEKAAVNDVSALYSSCRWEHHVVCKDNKDNYTLHYPGLKQSPSITLPPPSIHSHTHACTHVQVNEWTGVPVSPPRVGDSCEGKSNCCWLVIRLIESSDEQEVNIEKSQGEWGTFGNVAEKQINLSTLRSHVGEIRDFFCALC